MRRNDRDNVAQISPLPPISTHVPMTDKSTFIIRTAVGPLDALTVDILKKPI